MNALALAAWLATSTPVAQPATGLSFADALAADGDWYRAVTEYRRFAHHHPSHPLAEAARMRVGDLYQSAGKLDAAAAAYDELARDKPAPAAAAEATWRAARAFEHAGRLHRASERYETFASTWPADPRADHARYRRAWSLAADELPAAAAEALEQMPPGGRYQAAAAGLLAELRRPHDDGKSPLAAGILSAVLPGAGQAYAGRWGDGLLALLVNGTFGFGAYQAWENDNTATAVVMGMFTLGFYLGGVFGGVHAAQRHNDEAIDARRRSMHERFAEPHGAGRPPEVTVPLLRSAW